MSDFTRCRGYWLNGLCPCCGGELISWPRNGSHSWPRNGSHEDVEPKQIAEGVVMCGRCIRDNHDTNDAPTPGFLDGLLRSLVQ